RQLSLDPVLMPEPPIALRQGARSPWFFRLWLLLMLVAVGTFVTMWLVSSDPKLPSAGNRGDDSSTALSARPPQPAPPLLLVESQRGYANEPLALGVLLNGKVNGETLLLQGLSEGTRLSAGSPLGRTAWRL